MSHLNKTKIPKYSDSAIFEVSHTGSKWIITLIDKEKRKPVRLFKWWWQVQLMLWIHPELPIVRVGSAAKKKTYGNVDSGMR